MDTLSSDLSESPAQPPLSPERIIADFPGALRAGGVSLHYQPVIDLETGAIAGFEALMRWTHPQAGFIPPGVFIPVIEDSGLILEASRWALGEACAALKRIEQRTGYDRKLFMAVNFTLADFASPSFVDDVYNTISRSDVQPARIHLEITERLLTSQPEKAKARLELCRKAGMIIAIDDFGTGYSSLSHLHYFPIDTLKIDRSFVAAMHKSEPAMALVKSIVALGKNMKMKLVAEGAETLEEARTLKSLGCDMAQGYYFARPMPELDAIRFVSESGTMIL